MTWPTVPLGSVVTFLDNLRRPITAKDRVAGSVPYYGANGQQDSVETHLFDEPLVLLAEDGGHFAEPWKGVAYRIDGPSWVNNHAHVLRPRDQVDIGFLTRVLENYKLAPFVSGSTRGKLTKASAEKIPVPLPPLPEQRRIASILDQADALRTKRREAIEVLIAAAADLFGAVFGDPLSNPLELPTTALKDVTTKIGSGATPRGGRGAYLGGETTLVRSMNVHDNLFLRQGLVRINTHQARALDTVKLEYDDVLLNITGASVARVARTPVDVLPARVNQHVAIIRTGPLLNATFLERQLTARSMKLHLLRVGGAGATREAITKAQIEQLRILLPPLAQQEEFASKVSEIESVHELHLAHLARLDELFASLQQRAFAGVL